MKSSEGRLLLNHFQKQLLHLFRELVRISRTNPVLLLYWIRMYRMQKRAARIRRQRAENNLAAPPVMIFSITNRCNLNCAGCYANAQNREPDQEMTGDRIDRLFKEAGDLGTGIVMLAGGEPLMRPDILQYAGECDRMVFPVFTNGTLLRGELLTIFTRYRNLVPVLSVEGSKNQTDKRRGQGMYQRVEQAARELKKRQILFGLSVTVTRENFSEVMHPVMMRHFHNQGSRLFFFVEYVPQDEYDTGKCLSSGQKAILMERMAILRKQIPSVFICLPGDEEQYGGCLAAGRGFFHVSSTGQVEACPFAPYSDTNVKERSLEEALASKFLGTIRENHHMLKESRGGCALWENRQWVESRLKQIPECEEMSTL